MPAATVAPTGLGSLSGNSVAATAATASDLVKETAASSATAAEKIAATAKNIAETLTQLRFFVVKFMGFIEPAAIAAESPPPVVPPSPSRDSVQSSQQSNEEKGSRSAH
jgi:hypothetical protein